MTPAGVVTIAAILLVPFAGAGLALMDAAMGRSRSAAHTLVTCLCAISVAALVYFAFGFAWQGFVNGSAYSFAIGGKPWNWIAAGPFFFRGVQWDAAPGSLTACLQLLTVGLAAIIPIGAGSDRWRLGACCFSTALLAGVTYPLFAHWIWSGGWLAQLGANYGLGRGYVDAGGAGPIHVVGGLTALSVAWILGPRRGKSTSDGMPAAIPGHNAVLFLFACPVALLGWLGVNSACALAFSAVQPERVTLIVVNTVLSAASAALTVAAITRVRFGKPDASLFANGWVAGLVASSAGCAFLPPAAAVITGAIGGALVPFSVEWLELHLGLDDPGGAISVHGIAGLWSILAVGLLGRFPVGESGQWVAQVVGVATLLGFVLPLSYGVNWLIDRFSPQRVIPEGERQGLDLHELGAGAYPEFYTHGEDFL